MPPHLQLGPRADVVPSVDLSLRIGKQDGPVVKSLVTSPHAPGNELLVPKLAWCLIPNRHLKPKTTYHVEAVIRGQGERVLRWRFTTGR